MNRVLNIVIIKLPFSRKGFVVDKTKHSLKPKTLFLSILYTLYSLLATAQSFPVQVIPQAAPPAPIYFSDYANASTVNSPLRVQIILNDFTIQSREIRLKTYFQGNGISFQSNDIVVGATPLFLEGGTPLVLTNVELAPYFDFSNITGIAPNVYGQPIPEGAYQFCFEVIDVLTGGRLSNRTCATTVVFQNNPPFLVLPRNKTNVAEANPQNIIFQWTPRSINVTNVEYELSLVEIWDTQIDPQAAFLSSPPVFQTTTAATTYVYGPADPLLLSGKKYAWRVQAKAKQGTEEIGLFKNEGYSEIFSFSYATSCELPIEVSHEVKGSTNTNIFWNDFSTDIPEFTVRYRQKNIADAEWFLAKTTTNNLTLWDLKAGTTYEYQLNKNCGITQSDWSIAKEFTTALEFEDESVLDCGVSPDINLTNMEPLANINVGAKFKAGDFPVEITEVSGSNGKFTGKGIVSLPYLENIKVFVEFTNILINTDAELAEGTVVTVYDPTWKNILDVDVVIDVAEDIIDEFTGGDVNIEVEVNFPISDVENITIDKEKGKIIITGANGETKTSDYDEGDSYVITDSSGNTYNIDEDGKITKGAQAAEGGAATAQNTNGITGGDGTTTSPSVGNITASGVTVIFEKSNTTKYYLDKAEGTYEEANYPKATMPNGDNYYPVHKAVVEGKTDDFNAKITITNPKITINDLIVKTVSGQKIDFTVDDSTLNITVKGTNSYFNEEAIITYKDEDGKYQIAASFFVHHIKQHNIVDVVLVQVTYDNQTGTTLSDLSTDLNSIFGKAGASFTVATETLSLVKSDWDDNSNNQLDYDGSGLVSNYPEELKNIQQAYKAKNSNWDRSAYHLFLLPSNMPISKALSGFMPKTRQWGYLFNGHAGSGDAIENKDSDNLIAAHELGHGVFRLDHPFSNYDNTSGSGTNWLMDYNSGNQLSYVDWARMSDEGLNLGIFQDQEDGEIANRTWFTPDWTPFSIANSSIIRNAPGSNKIEGTVPGFRLNNDLAYDAKYDSSGKFKGYFTEGNDRAFELALISNISNNSVVYLYVPVPGECPNIFATNYEYVTSNIGSINIDDSNTNLTRFAIAQNCSTELCILGQEYFDSYKNLPTVEGSEEDYLRKVAELICQNGSEDLIEAQKQQYLAWQKSAKNISQNVQKPFSWEKYYNALNKLDGWITNDLDKLINDKERETLFKLAYGFESEVIELFSLEQKLDILKILLDGKLQKVFNTHHEAIANLITGVKNEEASAFINALEDSKHKVNNELLIVQLKNRLSDYFTGDAYSTFFREIIRLSKARAEDENLKMLTPLVWDVEQKDYVIVSYVQNRNDFEFSYNDATNKVIIKRCISCCSGTRGCGSNRKYQTLVENASPFDMIGLTILNDISPLASGCATDPRASEICGEMTPVPAIFLEYLEENEANQRWQNFAWNTFNVAITIGTLGEGAGAIAAIRTAEKGTRVAIAFQKSYQLIDFGYTVADITLQMTKTGPHGCNATESAEERLKCEEKWQIWTDISYALAAKGGADLLQNLGKSSAKFARYTESELREFVIATNFKRNGVDFNTNEIDDVIDQLEDIIHRNGLTDDYNRTLANIDNLAEAGANRLFKSIDEFKTAIAKGDNVFYVGKHTDITPRPTGVQSHHGVNSVWMKAKYSNYSANKAPSVYMLNNPNHNATRGVFNTWAKEMRIKQGVTKIDYSKVTKDDILDLAKKQFDAADTPQLVRDEYYNLWDDYLKTLTPK